jgi:zinc transport system substrate-binding protein
MSKTPFFAIVLFLLAVGQTSAQEPLRVMVSILPQAYFVEKIGGDLVEPSVMVQPGASPATYEPKPRQMARLSKSSLYLAIGVPFERTWLPRFASANPDMRIVQTDRAVGKIPMDHGRHILDVRHKAADAQSRTESLDPHIWLSPKRVSQLARSAATAMQAVDPANADHYTAGLKAFQQEIQELHDQLQAIFQGHHGQAFLVNHPSWGYLANDYGLRQVPLEYQGKPPSPSRMKKIIQWGRLHEIESILVQPQFSGKQARVVAEAIGARLAKADPLARDWASNLQRVAEVIASDLE